MAEFYDLSPEMIFRQGIRLHHYANTAYPLNHKRTIMQFKLHEPEAIEAELREDLGGLDELSLYVHVPFCKQRCRFCEYTVLENVGPETEDEYVDLLLQEMDLYAPLLQGKTIRGFDLGGGTPTKLSENNLRRITEKIFSAFTFAPDTVCSVETTPVIAATEPEKIRFLYELGYRRISMGIQTVSEKLLNSLGREGTTSIYERAVSNIRAAGFESFNVDLMYGFLHQDIDDFDHTLQYAISLKPDHITLYRNRYKGTKLEPEAIGVSIYKVMKQYRFAYDRLISAGYQSSPGKNTFSRIPGDYGTSDYLTNRVIYGMPYVGMGLGAQSFGRGYLAYNDGAATKKLERYAAKLRAGQFPIQDLYALPQDECMAKMLSVAFYFGFIDLPAFQKRFGVSLQAVFPEEIAYLLENDLMAYQGERLCLTKRGADYINGVIPQFYSRRTKAELIRLAGERVVDGQGRDEYLEAYDLEHYRRPSVAADCVIRSEDGKQVLLIRRGEHPFMNCYALPGGFVRNPESVEDAARRELFEETGVAAGALSLAGVFSKPDRDPRGWIISCVYTGRVDPARCKPVFGEDAIEVRWVPLAELDKLTLAFDHEEILHTVLSEHI